MSAKSHLKKLSVILSALMVVSMCPLSVSATDDSDVTFTFSESGIAVSDATAEGYKISSTDLTISSAGTYRITGKCSDGSINVKKETTDVVLILDNLDLSCSYNAPLNCKKSTSVTVKLEGTNTLTDKENPDDENSSDTEVADAFEGAVIKAKSGSVLKITGDGTLNADGSACKNGIKGASTTEVTVESGNINITSANNGLASDGSVLVKGGTLNITSGNDAIKSEPEEDDEESAGTVTVTGGNITLNADGDGIQSTNDLTITGGTFSVISGGGYTAEIDDDTSAKGIKSDKDIIITDGNFTINSADDSIHSNGNITITGGTYIIDSGDDGIHADYTLKIGEESSTANPVITVNNAYEGFEGAEIYLYSGTGTITTSDDGINSANSDFTEYSFVLEIDGGNWYINADGDGIDSNGSIVMNGGDVVVFGSSMEDNSAVDYETTFEVNGGKILAIGMSRMATVPTKGAYVAFGTNGMGGMGGMPIGNRPDGEMPTGDRPDDGGFIPMERPTGDRPDDGSFVPVERPTGDRPDDRSFVPVEKPTGDRPDDGGFRPDDGSMSTISIKAGDTVTIKDSKGNIVATTTAVKTANSVVYALTDESETYSLYVNDVNVSDNSETTPDDKPTEPTTTENATSSSSETSTSSVSETSTTATSSNTNNTTSSNTTSSNTGVVNTGSKTVVMNIASVMLLSGLIALILKKRQRNFHQ